MGFCMETTGMTQGSQGEPPFDLEKGSMENPDFKGEAESMEDDQDTEVRNSAAFPASVFTVALINLQITHLTF